MTAVAAIARRELFGYLLSPVGYLVTALYLLLAAGVYFALAPLMKSGFSQGQPASLRLFFEISIWVFFIVAPAVSMRTISEELRLGTFESLMTAPVREGQVILGKFIGAVGFLAVILLPTIVFVVALERYGRPDYGELVCGYAGLMLVGSALLATGIVASCLTGSQVLAYLATMFFWLLLLLATVGIPLLAGWAGQMAGSESAGLTQTLDGVASFFAPANPLARARTFVIGLVDTFSVVYFLAIIVFALFAATRVLGIRRTR